MIQRTKSESSAAFLLVLHIFRGFLLFVIKSKIIIQNIKNCRATNNRLNTSFNPELCFSKISEVNSFNKLQEKNFQEVLKVQKNY